MGLIFNVSRISSTVCCANHRIFVPRYSSCSTFIDHRGVYFALMCTKNTSWRLKKEGVCDLVSTSGTGFIQMVLERVFDWPGNMRITSGLAYRASSSSPSIPSFIQRRCTRGQRGGLSTLSSRNRWVNATTQGRGAPQRLGNLD